MDEPDPESKETVAQALERARRHARAALAETVAALRALLDAGSLATAGAPAAAGALSPVAELMGRLESWLEGDRRRDGALFEAMLDALDAEIVRWERRSRSEPEARTVLRAFLTVRELLWELSSATSSAAGAGAAEASRGPSSDGFGDGHGHSSDGLGNEQAPRAEPRLRRVEVEG